jgi:hypothetical protein
MTSQHAAASHHLAASPSLTNAQILVISQRRKSHHPSRGDGGAKRASPAPKKRVGAPRPSRNATPQGGQGHIKTPPLIWS